MGRTVGIWRSGSAGRLVYGTFRPCQAASGDATHYFGGWVSEAAPRERLLVFDRVARALPLGARVAGRQESAPCRLAAGGGDRRKIAGIAAADQVADEGAELGRFRREPIRFGLVGEQVDEADAQGRGGEPGPAHAGVGRELQGVAPVVTSSGALVVDDVEAAVAAFDDQVEGRLDQRLALHGASEQLELRPFAITRVDQLGELELAVHARTGLDEARRVTAAEEGGDAGRGAARRLELGVEPFALERARQLLDGDGRPEALERKALEHAMRRAAEGARVVGAVAARVRERRLVDAEHVQQLEAPRTDREIGERGDPDRGSAEARLFGPAWHG